MVHSYTMHLIFFYSLDFYLSLQIFHWYECLISTNIVKDKSWFDGLVINYRMACVSYSFWSNKHFHVSGMELTYNYGYTHYSVVGPDENMKEVANQWGAESCWKHFILAGSHSVCSFISSQLVGLGGKKSCNFLLKQASVWCPFNLDLTLPCFVLKKMLW